MNNIGLTVNLDDLKFSEFIRFINTSNMHVFDEKCMIRKVHSPEEIIDRFYKVRKEHFVKRKGYLVDKLGADCALLEAKIRFIKLVISEKKSNY